MQHSDILSSKDCFNLTAINYKIPCLQGKTEVSIKACNIGDILIGIKQVFPGLNFVNFTTASCMTLRRCMTRLRWYRVREFRSLLPLATRRRFEAYSPSLASAIKSIPIKAL